MYRFPDIPVIFGTDIEGSQCIDAACHADENTGKHRDQNAGRADGTQCQRTGKFTDHGNI